MTCSYTWGNQHQSIKDIPSTTCISRGAVLMLCWQALQSFLCLLGAGNWMWLSASAFFFQYYRCGRLAPPCKQGTDKCC